MDGHELHSTCTALASNNTLTLKKEKPPTKFSVDPANQFVDDGPQVLVFLDVLPTGDSHLHQHNFPNPLGMVREEDLKGVQLLRYTLDIIEAVYTYHELYALEFLLQHCDSLLDLFLFEALLELLRVDANGEGPAGNNFALELNSIGRRGQSSEGAR